MFLPCHFTFQANKRDHAPLMIQFVLSCDWRAPLITFNIIHCIHLTAIYCSNILAGTYSHDHPQLISEISDFKHWRLVILTIACPREPGSVTLCIRLHWKLSQYPVNLYLPGPFLFPLRCIYKTECASGSSNTRNYVTFYFALHVHYVPLLPNVTLRLYCTLRTMWDIIILLRQKGCFFIKRSLSYRGNTPLSEQGRKRNFRKTYAKAYDKCFFTFRPCLRVQRIGSTPRRAFPRCQY